MVKLLLRSPKGKTNRPGTDFPDRPGGFTLQVGVFLLRLPLFHWGQRGTPTGTAFLGDRPPFVFLRGPEGFYKSGDEELGRTCPRCFHTCSKCESATSADSREAFPFLSFLFL